MKHHLDVIDDTLDIISVLCRFGSNYREMAISP